MLEDPQTMRGDIRCHLCCRDCLTLPRDIGLYLDAQAETETIAVQYERHFLRFSLHEASGMGLQRLSFRRFFQRLTRSQGEQTGRWRAGGRYRCWSLSVFSA